MTSDTSPLLNHLSAILRAVEQPSESSDALYHFNQLMQKLHDLSGRVEELPSIDRTLSQQQVLLTEKQQQLSLLWERRRSFAQIISMPSSSTILSSIDPSAYP